MARETIVKPDATRIPFWMIDGATNIIFKLAKQFMSFTAVSHERLLMRGLNERTAYAMTGMAVSSGILFALDYASDVTATSLGLLNEVPNDIDTEEGLINRAKASVLRNSFSGWIGRSIEMIDQLGTWESRNNWTTFAGGVTGQRLSNTVVAGKQLLEGKTNTRQQADLFNSMIPFQNMYFMDTFNRIMTDELIGYERKNQYRFGDL